MTPCRTPERFELHLHGGLAVVHAVGALLENHGARLVPPQSATGRQLAADACGVTAYQQGIGAEILAALPGAQTPAALALLTAQVPHGLTAWRDAWLPPLSQGAVPLWPFHSAVQWLLDRAALLRRLLEPARIALLGPPNAGKSTLANTLLGRPMSITSNQPGTTRDWVDAPGLLATDTLQVPVIFIDTAGLRPTADPIETESIRRSRVQWSQADAAVLVLDGSSTDPAQQDLLDQFQPQSDLPPLVVVRNKADVYGIAPAPLRCPAAPMIDVSGLTGQGIGQLIAALLDTLDLGAVDLQEPFAFTPRQCTILEQAATACTHATAAAALREL